MKKQRLIFRTVILLVLLMAVGYALYQNLNSDKGPIKIGGEAPTFELPDMKGNTINLSSYKGKGVFINFWGSWCEPCEKEMPYINDLSAAYKDKGVEVLAVNADETPLVIQTFMDKYNLQFPVLQDKGQRVLQAYGGITLPMSVLVDKDGKIVEIINGTQTKESLEGYFKKIMP